MKLTNFILILIGGLTSACSLDKLPKVDSLFNVFSNDIGEINTRPEDSIEYNCEKKKIFFLFYLNDIKSVWVVLPGREFKLNQIDETHKIYSNNITTLEISPEKTQIKIGDEIIYGQCVEKKAAAKS